MTTPETVGRYVIRRELGRGGMAIVYVAYDPRFEREVALKLLPSYFVHEIDFRTRFEREAKTLARLEHYAIVPVYDFGQEDSPYLVMRYMKGGTLKGRMKSGAISLDEAVEIIRRIGAALDATHAIGIIHRDLKPDNILFDEIDRAYLSDFGIVKLAESSKTFTKTGGILGTPAYMSPEQATGAKGIDERSDIYSLGVILYEMLAGKAPYEADTTVRLIMKHVTEPIPDILKENPSLPPACDAIIRRVMAKKPEERYDSCASLLEALDGVLERRGSSSTAVSAADSEPTRLDQLPTQSSSSSTHHGATSPIVPGAATPTPGTAAPATGAQPQLPPREVPPAADSAAEGRSRRWIWAAGAVALVLGALATITGLLLWNNYRQDAVAAADATGTAAAEIAVQATRQVQQTTTAIAAAAESTDVALVISAEGTRAVQTRIVQEAATSEAIAAAATATELARPTATLAPTPIGGAELIAFDSSRNGNRDIFVMKSDGSGLVQLTDNEADDGDPVWSPDGTRILFGSLRDGDWELYVMDPDGSNVNQLTDNSNIDWAGKWSPDGTRIVFASDRDGNLEIYAMDADGSNQMRLTTNTVIDAFPSWSPDGQRILFESVVSEGGRDFFLMNPDGTDLTRLMINSDFDRNPSWSPDGTRIVFTTNRMSDDEIYFMNSDGTNPIRLTNSPGQDFAPKWSPDGNRILFVSERDGNREVYMMNMDGSNPVNLTNSAGDDQFPNWKEN